MDTTYSQNERRYECFQKFYDKPIGIKPVGRPRSKWDENIWNDLKEIGIISRNLINSAQDMGYVESLMNASLHLRFP